MDTNIAFLYADARDAIEQAHRTAATLPSSREVALVATKLDEARLWLAEATRRDPDLHADAAAAVQTSSDAAPSGQDAEQAADPAPASETSTAGDAATSDAVEVSPSPTEHRCPECGTYYTDPATCAVKHPPAETVTVEPPAEAQA